MATKKAQKAKSSKSQSSKQKMSKGGTSKATTSNAKANARPSRAKTPKEVHFIAWNEDRTVVEPVVARPTVKITEYRLRDGDKWVTSEAVERSPEPAAKTTATRASKRSKTASSGKLQAVGKAAAQKGKKDRQAESEDEADEAEDKAELDADESDVGWKHFATTPSSAREVMLVEDPDSYCLHCKRRGTVKTKCGEPCYQAFRKQLFGAGLVEIKQGPFGYGAYTRPDAKPIKKYQYIDEYIGELRPETVSQGSRYFCAIEGVCQVDAGEYGNWTRFLNSSCDPNLEAKTEYAGKRKFVVFRAIKDIGPETELTFHYGAAYFGPFGIRCSCGAKPGPHSPFEMDKPKRGRKRKADTVVEDGLHHDAAEAEVESSEPLKKAAKTTIAVNDPGQSKRKPGRPPKKTQPVEEAITTEHPKKRGRPKKNESAGKAAAGAEPPKKRGRPKKAEEDDGSEDVAEPPKKRGRRGRS